MKIIVFFDEKTGQIFGATEFPNPYMSDRYSSLEADIEDPYPDGYVHKYVEDGRLLDMPAKPSECHRFDYVTKQWIDPRTHDAEWPLVRAERDRRLLASDWTQLPDVPLATKEAWATYRQALRDITEQPDPFNITWPAVPG